MKDKSEKNKCGGSSCGGGRGRVRRQGDRNSRNRDPLPASYSGYPAGYPSQRNYRRQRPYLPMRTSSYFVDGNSINHFYFSYRSTARSAPIPMPSAHPNIDTYMARFFNNVFNRSLVNTHARYEPTQALEPIPPSAPLVPVTPSAPVTPSTDGVDTNPAPADDEGNATSEEN